MRRIAGAATALVLIGLLAACGGASKPSINATSSQPASASSSGSTGPTSNPSGLAGTAVSALPPPPGAPPAPSSASSSSTPPAGQTLPLNDSTGSAAQVLTVVASSTSSTTATLQAWDRATGGGWTAHGGAVTAHLGSAGLSSHPSESVSATPIGSFALTRAFGALGNPGTAITYHQTTSADWWISQAGSLYNTMQTCSSGCAFALGDPNEHLAAIRPQYNYAVVIEYNTGPVVPGAGSAFFLHVTDGGPTAGCVSVAQADLVAIMQWLKPSAAPRILIGVH